MRSIRNLFLSFAGFEWFNPNSKSVFYILLLAFIILLIATENIIKQTFI